MAHKWMICLLAVYHAIAGFGGVLKNQSIGIASRSGKTNIHSAGRTGTTTARSSRGLKAAEERMWWNMRRVSGLEAVTMR